MKNILFYLALFLVTSSLFAQQGINYKAIILDNGTVLQNQVVQVQFSVLENGTILEYKETQSATTDANGIIILSIGEGTPVSGLYDDIGWYNELFLKVEIDTGSGYEDFGTTAFKTVPYAIYAENGNGAKKLNQLADVNGDLTSLYLGNYSGTSEIGGNLDNSALGNYSLKENLNGSGNNAIGVFSLQNNTTGSYNTANGAGTLYNNISGTRNTSLGAYSGHNSIGDSNVFIGYRSGYNETGSSKLYIENTDSNTPLIGGDFNTNEVTINGSIAIIDGTEGAAKVLTSDANGKATWEVLSTSSVGQINDLSNGKTDTYSVFLGNQSGDADDGDNWNTAVGNSTLTSNTSGIGNSAIGYGALYYNTAGLSNVAIGTQTLLQNQNGNSNVAIGNEALRFNVNGNENISIGHKAGFETLGNGNIFIGHRSGYNELGSNKLYIENSDSGIPLIGGDFSANQVTINGALNVTGNVTGNVAGDVTGDLTGDVIGNVDGNITATHSGTADMKAYLFGSVGTNGVTFAASSSDGFTSMLMGTGDFKVSSTGLVSYTVIATMRDGFIGFITVDKFAHEFRITTYNISGAVENRAFDFVVFKK
ncbi:hypothetical protein ERX46_08520 [Brumimicrobium glaciale]|uniref:Uncharacterized protein n=1 Tax=Brumimicrobium glaciale TaxID=200475 RepID=A0A4Q4KM05_9FLAO|nr:hypothetical protein [Brumimicrobium glaciale]RYM34000.1 hypothetical protein ERX46_08520 [Brumimicrobium glaciale]